MTKDSVAVTTDILYYGPRNTTPGGKWYKEKKPEEPERDDCCVALDVVAIILCCAMCNNVSCNCDCCPDDSEHVGECIYEDPVTKQLFDEKGYLCPKDTGLGDATPEDLDRLRAKYTPPVAGKITGRS